MKAKITACSVIMLVISALVASAATAECLTGKTEVTIVNPAGKIITICVPDAAVDHIGGPGDIVIPATCPCFTAEIIEEMFALLPGTECLLYEGTGSCGDTCTWIPCYNPTVDDTFQAIARPAEDKLCPCGFDPRPPALPVERNACTTITIVDGIVEFGPYIHVSEAEADACVAILKTFVEFFATGQQP